MWLHENGYLKEDSLGRYHFVTDMSKGDMKNPKNFREVCSLNGIDFDNIVTAQQVHGGNVSVAGISHRGTGISGTDGIISSVKGLVLAVFTADCMAVFLSSSKTCAAGIVHAGWRGLAAGVLENAVHSFEENLGVKSGDLRAAIGPHIRECCFGVGDEVRQAFGIRTGAGTIDLSGIAAEKLVKLGVKNISVNENCTCHNNGFYSYRRDKTAGRMVSLIKI